MKYYMVVFLVNREHGTHSQATQADYVTVIKIMPAIHQGLRGELCHFNTAGEGDGFYLFE